MSSQLIYKRAAQPLGSVRSRSYDPGRELYDSIQKVIKSIFEKHPELTCGIVLMERHMNGTESTEPQRRFEGTGPLELTGSLLVSRDFDTAYSIKFEWENERGKPLQNIRLNRDIMAAIHSEFSTLTMHSSRER